ncbi:NTP transferase domain-containing protein [Pleomorphovibrio marinus]|uniref:NTP transferase domain-containing protein n=1 Tax=Pleomorphovibrio marinus TaxID=2164132 RepID=UPI0021D05755|nr:NTP transferase domain-containing protein [Pleomorphovibrio marinus]
MISSDSPESLCADLTGLILIGGKSSRMKRDKSLLEFHGKTQREHLANLLKKITPNVSFSCNATQLGTTQKPSHCVVDRVKEAGPLGGIISAHLEFPHHAWFVTACDMPFITLSLLQELYSQRNPKKMATAFRHPHTGYPEPLFAIYEPEGLKMMKLEFEQGEKSPSRLLGKMQVEWLIPSQPERLANVNDAEALERAKEVIQNRQA